MLVPGDVVEVTEGDLMNLQGKVISVDGNTVTVLPRHEDLKVIMTYFHFYIPLGTFPFRIVTPHNPSHFPSPPPSTPGSLGVSDSGAA